jgi:FtsH-binding integral membrane protein
MSKDAGLRKFMLGVYNKLALGIALAGVLAFVAGTVPAVTQLIFGTPPAAPIGGTDSGSGSSTSTYFCSE